MIGQQVIKCPQCGGNKVKSQGIIVKGLLLSGVIACMTIILIPAGIVLFIAALVASLMKIKLRFSCIECKHAFKVIPEVYKSYSATLKNNKINTKSPTH